MKALIAFCFLGFATTVCRADVLPYERWETTGLMDNVRLAPDKLSRIIFTRRSDRETRFILDKLVGAGISGITTDRDLSIPGWQQKLLIEGDLGKTVKKTRFLLFLLFGDSEPYRDFTLRNLKIRFPLYCWDQTPEGTLKIYKTIEDLFPTGLHFDGKPVDLQKYEERTIRSSESR